MARLLLAISAAAAVFCGVDAHNYVLKPLTEFKAGTPGYGNWVAEFKPPFSGDVSNGRSFMQLAKARGFSTVRSFIENRGPDCGNSNPTAKAKAIPSGNRVQLYRSMDHPGSRFGASTYEYVVQYGTTGYGSDKRNPPAK